MDPKVVLVFTWIVAGLVVAAYIWFVLWRYRVDRRKQKAQAVTDAAMSDAIARTAEQASQKAKIAPKTSPAPTAVPPTEAPSTATTATPSTPVAPAPRAAATTVAEALSGIALPHDLVPLTTMAARMAVVDRVAFWTDRAPAEVVGPAFADELERLGYTVASLDEKSLSAQRDDDRLLVVIHPDGEKATVDGQLAFSSVPERSVVIEVWLPA